MAQEHDPDGDGSADADATDGASDSAADAHDGASDSAADAPDGASDSAADAPDGQRGGVEDDDRPAVVEEEAVASAFVDAAPRTLSEVVDETGLDRDAVERGLEALVDADALAVKTLEMGAASLRVWYLPANAHVERLAPGTPDANRAEAVAETIDGLAVPGVSEMMQDWRRDAIRAAWEYLVEHGAATDAAVVDAVYPGHSAGYDDRDAWWDCVRPRLASLPGVTPPDDGTDDVWTYAPA